MKELIQAADFYASLNEEEKADLAEAIAADIFFLNQELQHGILSLLYEVDPRLGEEVSRRNDFTI